MEFTTLKYLNSMRTIIPYNPKLKEFAKQLRNNSTKSEIRLWYYLKGKQRLGCDFHRQKPIDDFIIDFYCCELLLAIELDGITHTFEDSVEKDKARDERLRSFGITVLRFDDSFVLKNINWVLEEIDETILKLKHLNPPLNPSKEGKPCGEHLLRFGGLLVEKPTKKGGLFI